LETALRAAYNPHAVKELLEARSVSERFFACMTTASSTSESSAPPTDSKWRKLADNPVAVIALVFLVTGCLGIPVILICRRFTPLQKAFWIVVSILYTGFLFYLVALVWIWVYTDIMKAINGG
jgi:hypothetical protein